MFPEKRTGKRKTVTDEEKNQNTESECMEYSDHHCSGSAVYSNFHGRK